MRELTRCADGVYATQLQRALDVAGIAARVTTEMGNVYLGKMEFVVWVAEEADPEAVRTAYRLSLLARLDNPSAWLPRKDPS